MGDAADRETRKQQSSIVMGAFAELADKDLALRTGYSSQRGTNVLQAGETVITNFNELVSSIKASISNQEARDAFSVMASRREIQFKTYVNGHTTAQLEAARVEHATAAVDASTNTAVFEALTGNTAATAQAIAEGEAMLRGFKLGSLDTDGVQEVEAVEGTGVASQEEIIAYRTQAHASVLRALVNDGQAKQAELYFDANKGNIEAKTRDKLDDAVSAAGRRVDAQANVSEIWEGNLDDNGEIDIGAAIEELDAKSSEMHPQTFEKTREGLLAKGKEQKAVNRASDKPHVDTLKLGFLSGRKRFGPGDPDFDVLSVEGKVQALSWLAAETRSRRTSSRAARQWQRDLDKDALAQWGALERINPDGIEGGDQLSIDIDDRYPDSTERARNEMRRQRRRLEEKMRKDGGESEKAFTRDLKAVEAAFDFSKKDIVEFETSVYRQYDEWAEDNKNKGKKNPSSEEVKGWISKSIETGQERAKDVTFFRSKMRRFEAQAEGTKLEFPNAGKLAEKKLEEAIRLEEILGKSGPPAPAAVRPGAPLPDVVLRLRDPNTGKVISMAAPGHLVDAAREQATAKGYEVLN